MMLQRFSKFRLATLLTLVACVAIGMAVHRALTQEIVRGHSTPEAAATAMFRAGATKDHKLFARTRLLSVCEGVNDWPDRYAEFLHTTTFASSENQASVYELPRRLKSDTARAVARESFGPEHDAFLHMAMVSSYYGERFVCVEVAAEDRDGLEYSTRIVVAKLDDRWYAVPRLRRSGFYEIADAMTLSDNKVNAVGSKPASNSSIDRDSRT